jgi:hypothetical protein
VWADVPNAVPFSDPTQMTLYINNTTGLDGYKFRCEVTDACSSAVISNTATLTVTTNTGIPGLWTGAISNHWNTGGNWDDNITPVSTTNVIIPASSINQPVVSSDSTASCNNITIKPRASLTVQGTLVAKGNLTIESDASGTGAFMQNDEAVVNISGNATLNGYLLKPGYHYITSPFSSASVNNINNFTFNPFTYAGKYYVPESSFPASAFPNMYKRDEQHTHDIPQDMNGWLVPHTGEIMPPTKGYAINLTRGSITISITQPASMINSGNYSYNVSKEQLSTDTQHNGKCVDDYGNPTGYPKSNCVGNGPADGFHLVGNPYPSPLDITMTNLSDFTTQIAYFKPTSQYFGIYGYYNINIGAYGAFYPSKYVPSMQSFFLQNSIYISPTEPAPILSFTNAMRSVDRTALTNNLYKRTSEENKSIKFIRLSASIADNNRIKDETVILFNNVSSDGFNPMFDANKLFNTDENVPNIYFIVDRHFLASKAFTQITDNLIIPIGFSTNSNGKYIINVSEINNMPADTKVYLIDTRENITQDLTNKPDYTFDMNGTDNNRFFLKFAINSEPGTLNSELCYIYTSDKDLFVNYSNPKNERADLKIYSISGELIKSGVNLTNGIYHNILNFAPGIYLVKVISADNVYVQKVYIQ